MGLPIKGQQIDSVLDAKIVFGPPEAKNYSGAYHFNTTASSNKALPITAIARTEAPAMPDLTPASISFGSVEIGRDVHQTVTLTNRGEASMTLQSIDPKTASAMRPFTITDEMEMNPAPHVIEGGATVSVPLHVHFTPMVVGGFADDVELQFDGGLTTKLHVTGTGVASGMLSCDTMMIAFGQVARGQTARQHVHCTVTGGQFTVQRISPSANTSTLFSVPNPPNNVTTTSGLDFDVMFKSQGLPEQVSGTIEIQSAANTLTRITVTGEVIPPPVGQTAVSVKLTWNTPNTDFDLHLTRNGASPFTPVDDCYYGDKNPDWGMMGNPDDDPYLDHDTTTGWGPENINLTIAAETTYDVWVYYYNFSGASAPSTVALVDVNIMGVAAPVSMQTVPSCGEAWHVGTIHMNTRMFVSDTSAMAVNNQYQSHASSNCL
jgi:hypothetical protein